jgi:hypothetical protein
LIRYADHSARGVAPLAKLAWRPRKRPSRGFRAFVTRSNALESRADRGMRAYVTGGDRPPVTTRAGSTVHARYGRTACHWRARGSLQASGARVTRSTHRTLAAISGVGLRGTAGDACVCLQALPPKVATLRAARDAMVPLVLTGTRGRNNEIRARTPRRSRHPEAAPDVSILRQAQNRYAASDATSVQDRGNKTALLGLS